MRILFLNHNLAWRGSFFRCLGFARELVRLGHHVDLWTVSPRYSPRGKRENLDGVNVWQTPRWSAPGNHDGGYALVDNLVRLVRAGSARWDLVHAFEHRPNVLLPWLGLRLLHRLSLGPSPMLFFSDWSDWWAGGGITTSRRRFAALDRMERWVEERSKLGSDGVTVISTTLYQRAVELGIEPERLALIPAGVPIESFPRHDRLYCRKMLQLPLERPLLGFAGFSLWDMGLLAEVLTRVKNEVPDCGLLVVGGGVEEKAKAIFHERCVMGQDVFLPGVVPFAEIPLYLGACDVNVLPMEDRLANRARLPNKLMDYYAAGRAVVASDVGDAGAYVREHQTGIAAPGGAEAFSQACVALLRDAPRREAMGNRARELAETRFSYHQLCRDWLSFYHRRMEARREM